MAGPLEGIRVLDLTSMVSGPLATMILADQGADVIKVEPPTGEQMRHLRKHPLGVPASFFSCNRGKRSIGIDLKSCDGLDVVKKLIESTDVLVQNFRPGTMDRMGLSEEEVRGICPEIIYVSISGFGETGPYSHQRVYDPIIQALSGVADIQADRETRQPHMVRTILADKVTSITAAQAITAALVSRANTGKGQHIRLSMLDAVVALMWPEGMASLTYVDEAVDPATLETSPELIYETRDGYASVGAVSDAEWRGLCRAVGRPELIDDERFRTAEARVRNVEERRRTTADAVRQWNSAELLARLNDEDVPSAPVRRRIELADDPQFIANELLEVHEFEGLGVVRQPRPAARFDRTKAQIRGAAPRLSEHAVEILRDAGLSRDESDELLRNGTVAPDHFD